MLSRRRVIIGMGRTERIERHGEGTENEDADIVEPGVGAGHQRDEQARGEGAEGCHKDDQPPVELVGIVAERVLQHDAREDADTHEGGNRRDRQPDTLGIDGPSDRKLELVSPTTMQPTVASGETFQSALMSKRTASGADGLERSANEIGTSDRVRAIEMMANSWNRQCRRPE